MMTGSAPDVRDSDTGPVPGAGTLLDSRPCPEWATGADDDGDRDGDADTDADRDRNRNGDRNAFAGAGVTLLHDCGAVCGRPFGGSGGAVLGRDLAGAAAPSRGPRGAAAAPLSRVLESGDPATVLLMGMTRDQLAELDSWGNAL